MTSKVHIERPGYMTACGMRDDEVKLSARDEANARNRADLKGTTVCARCLAVLRAEEYRNCK